MANIASSRLAFGAVLGTITTTATAVSDTVTGLGKTAGMFNRLVDNMAEQQAVRHKLDQKSYAKQYTNQKALELFKLEAEIKKEVGDDKADGIRFNEILADLESALK